MVGQPCERCHARVIEIAFHLFSLSISQSLSFSLCLFRLQIYDVSSCGPLVSSPLYICTADFSSAPSPL